MSRSSSESAAVPTAVHAPRRRSWWLAALKLAIVAVLAWGIRGTLATAFARLADTRVALDWPWFVVAGVAYLVGMLPCGLFWQHVLWRLGQSPRLYETLRAYYIGHLGKYVPGKALVVVLRAGLIRGARVDTAIAAVSVFVETLTQMAVGAVVAAVILAAMFHDQWHMMLLAAGLACVAGLPICPPVFRRLVRLTGVGRKYPQVAARLIALDPAALATGWPTIAAGWFVIGGSVWAVTRGIGLAPGTWPHGLLTLTAVAALATVAGFLSLIPGGLGVRDLILTTLLVPYCAAHAAASAEAAALAVAIILRVTWLLAELTVAGVTYLIRPAGVE